MRQIGSWTAPSRQTRPKRSGVDRLLRRGRAGRVKASRWPGAAKSRSDRDATHAEALIDRQPVRAGRQHRATHTHGPRPRPPSLRAAAGSPSHQGGSRLTSSIASKRRPPSGAIALGVPTATETRDSRYGQIAPIQAWKHASKDSSPRTLQASRGLPFLTPAGSMRRP